MNEKDILPLDYFICPFCHNIIVDPVTCSECLTGNFCSKCAMNQVAINGKCSACPIIISPQKLITYAYFLKRYQDEKIKCPRNSCNWSGNIPDFLKHREECKQNFNEVKTPKEPKKDDINDLNLAETRLFSAKCIILCVVGLFICFFLTWIQSLLWGGEKYPNHEYSTPKRKIIEEIDNIDTEIKKLKIMMLTNWDSKSINGIFTDTHIDFFKNCGFKEGMKAKFSNISEIDFYSYQDKSYILAGIRKVNDPKFILAGVGIASDIFSTPYWNNLHLNLNIFWYFTHLYTFGFSIHSNVSLSNIDNWRSENSEFDNYKLSISQNGTAAGRVGNVFISEENGNLDDYEYVIMDLA